MLTHCMKSGYFSRHILGIMKLSTRIWIIICLFASAAGATSALGETGPLKLEKIVCEGNQRTSCDYLIGLTSLKQGQILEDEQVRTARMRLRLLGNFDDVELRLAKGTEFGSAIMTIAVVENSPYSMLLNAGLYDPWDGVEGLFDLTGFDRNLTGHGDPLSLRVRLLTNVWNWADSHGSEYSVLARLEYTRPGILGITRLFATGGLSYLSGNSMETGLSNYDYGFKTLTVDAALGYRIFNYSYLMVGARGVRNWDTNFEFYPENESYPGIFAQYGWDSEDNPNFPTEGSRFQLFYSNNIRDYDSYQLSLGYRKHFALTDKDILTLELGDFRSNDNEITNEFDPRIGLRFSRYFIRHAESAMIKNAAWFVEGGSYGGDSVHGVGGRVGLNLETSYGLINLSFLGITQ